MYLYQWESCGLFKEPGSTLSKYTWLKYLVFPVYSAVIFWTEKEHSSYPPQGLTRVKRAIDRVQEGNVLLFKYQHLFLK